jgi:hypothetical protein
MLLPWVLQRSLESPHAQPPLALEYPTVSQKVIDFFGFSLDNLNGSFGESIAALSLVLLLFGPLAFACLPRSDGDGHRWSGALVALAALALYAALPMGFYGPVQHWYTYPRYASYFLAALLLVPPVQTLPPVLLIPGVMTALAGNAATVVAFRAFGGRVEPFVPIVDAVPAGARLLPLEYVDQDPVVKFPPLAHLHSYVTAKVTFDPHLLDNANTPIRYRSDLSIPRISWLGPREFTLAKYAPHFDYILVQGIQRDPFGETSSAGGYHVRLVLETGIWRLYAVEHD